MGIENPNLNQEKAFLWKNKLKELEKVIDKLGKPIDKNILETIAGLNLLGIPTGSSCGGHLISKEGSMGLPYFGGNAPKEPEIRFEGEQELRNKISLKYGIDPKEVAVDKTTFHEYWDTIQNGEEKYKETGEYQKWMAENEYLMARIVKLLEDFYQNKMSGKIRLHLAKIYPGYRVETIDKEELKTLKKQGISEAEAMAKIDEQIRDAQKEIADFTEFLKQRFANSQ